MRKVFMFLAFILFLGINSFAQSLYVCERYDEKYGPIGVSNAFTTGYVTVVVESNSLMYYDFVYVQYDRMDKDGEYRFYKQFPFTFPNGHKIVYFSRSVNNDMEFNHTGNYIVWLLNKNKKVIAYTYIKIVN